MTKCVQPSGNLIGENSASIDYSKQGPSRLPSGKWIGESLTSKDYSQPELTGLPSGNLMRKFGQKIID